MPAERSPALSLPTLVVFSLPGVVLGVTNAAIGTVIPAFYAKYTAATLAGVGAALFFARIAEVLIDPMIGHLSDITRGRHGPRKPWVLVGSFLLPIPVYFLFAPFEGAGNTWFLIWSATFYIAWSVVNIPYRAWGTEISRDYLDRSRIFTALGLAAVLGAVLFAVSPFLPFAAETGMTPGVLAWLAIVLVVAYPLSGLITTMAVGRGGDAVAADRPALKDMIGAIRGNRPFAVFVTAYMLGGVGQGMVLACFFFYIDNYLGLGPKFPLALLLVYLGGLVGMPIWLKLTPVLGKHRVWAIGWGLSAAISVALAMVPAGEAGALALLVLVAAYGAVFCVEVVTPFAVLGDVIDYDILKTGVNRAGNYNALAILAQKANVAIGGALAFFVLDAFGFDASMTELAGSARQGFLLAFVGLPVLLYGVSCLFIWRFPIDKRRHDVILRRITGRRRSVSNV